MVGRPTPRAGPAAGPCPPVTERSDCPSGVAHGTMEAVQLLLVDAFTSSPFTGNPAGVCLTDADDAAWMQAVAAEVNVSETAFVDLSTLATTGEVGLRWFTPKVEVEICGHATLASAHVLFEQGLAESPIAFRTASGVLRAEALPGGGIQLDFPVDVPISALPDSHLADEFADALGAAIVEIARCRYDVLVEIPSAAEVRDLEPDLSVLRAASGRGVIVTARAEEDPTAGCPRLRLPVLRPRRGDRRGPGDGLGALLPRAVLVVAARAGPPGRCPALPARRGGRRRARGRARPPARRRGHRQPWRAARRGDEDSTPHRG